MIVKIINKIRCFFFGHKYIYKTYWNKEKETWCERCNKQFNIEYSDKCEITINGKRYLAPVYRANKKTIWIGFKNKIIKRHIIKHKVIFIS